MPTIAPRLFAPLLPIQAKPRFAWLLIVPVMLLAACGGGGEEASTPSASTAASTTATTATTTTTTSTNASTSSPVTTTSSAPSASPSGQTPSTTACGIANFAQAILAKVNELRAQGGTCGARGSFAASVALSWNAKLEQAALGHSTDMMTNNFFSHTSADGRSLTDRINATGYSWMRLGENIAASYATVDQVMAAWMSSDGHCANILNPNFREIGVACVTSTGASAYANYWTQDFGAAP